MYKISPSSINLMEECPRCFWLAIHGKWKRPQGIFPSLPSGMDGILKIHFDKFRDKGELPPEIREECSDCKLFDDKEKLKIWRSNFKGIQYTEGDFMLRGAVDNLLVKNGKLIVLDYKTRGFPLKDDTHEHYKVQMDIYNFLLRKNGYSVENYSYLLFYYPNKVNDNGEVIFDTKLIKMKVGDGEKVFKKAVNVINGKEPKEKCEWCKGV
jgi:CRISPR/Cas system-associated exonuclease Cas4 (RecB family)